MRINPTFPADLVTFTEEILNGKLHFLSSEHFTYRLVLSTNNLAKFPDSWLRLFDVLVKTFSRKKMF